VTGNELVTCTLSDARVAMRRSGEDEVVVVDEEEALFVSFP